MHITESRNTRVPRVSVVMALNRADPYLQDAIQSVLSQTFPDFEFLIVLDQNSAMVADSILQKYPDETRIRILASPPLGGLAHALNVGIAEARGQYIARMDGDDISLPNRFIEQVQFLDEHPETAVVGCRVQMIGPDSELLPTQYPYYETDAAIRRILPIRNPMPHPALMMRRSSLYAVGGYKFGHMSEDHELFIRIARNAAFGFHNLTSILFHYRRHGGQATNLHYFKRRFPDVAGFLFSELLRSHSPRYLLGMIAVHPWSRHLRRLFQRDTATVYQ